MNSFRQWLATQIEMSLMRAEARQIRRYFMENFFLLGIEIGQRRRLTASERTVYRKTLNTAEALIAIGKYTGSRKFECQLQWELTRIVGNWLKDEPELRKNIEYLLKMPVEYFNRTGAIPANLRMTLQKEMKELAASCCEFLSEDQIEAIIQQIENPLDRV